MRDTPLQNKHSIRWRRFHRNRLLIFGITLMLLGLAQLPTIWTFKSSLVKIEGTISRADTYVNTVTDRRGHKSHQSELIFYLEGHSQKYALSQNIGNQYSDKKYETILQGLNSAKTVSVWIKKGETEALEPQVFQIDSDRKTLLDFDSVQMEKSPITAILLLLGLSSIIGYFWSRRPDKFNQFFGIGE